MAKTLTAVAVEKAKPGDVRREIPDASLPSFYLVVQPSGAKSWALRYRAGGKPRKLTLGAYPALDLAAARTSARDALRTLAEGRDPAAEKVARRQARDESRDLLQSVVDDFLKRHASKNRSAWLTERYFRVEVLPHWGERRIQDITRRDVVELLDRIVDRGRAVTANRVFSAIRKLFNWALERDIVQGSPCAGLRAPAAETSRDRVLSDDELRSLWKACDDIPYPFGPLVKLLILTGQRLSEVGGMEWSEVDLDKHVWTIPSERAKNGRTHTVPLSEPALAVLGKLPRLQGRGYVFTTTGTTPVSGWSAAKRSADRGIRRITEGDITDWSFHDLRRTLATGMQRLGFPIEVVEAVLNHKSGAIRGVAAVYARHDFADEKRRALEAWGRLVDSLLTDDATSNVIPIARAL